MIKIVTIGEILVEIMAQAAGRGFREAIPLLGPFPSGAPAIFIDQAARLGQPCGIVACVGQDDFGLVNLDRLARDGVDVSAVAVDPDRPTGSAFVRYREDGSRDFVFNIRHSACASTALTPEAIRLVAEAGHLHVMGSSLISEAIVEATLEAARQVRAGGGTVSFDPNLRKELLDRPGLRIALDAALSCADLFLPSGDELFLFGGYASEDEAIRAVLGRGVRAIVIKRGAGGATFVDAASRVDAPAFAVPEVDPTGAGDCFGATFVTCWLRGMAPDRALRLANASGALAVGRAGPMEGTSTMAEIEAFLLRHPGGVAA